MNILTCNQDWIAWCNAIFSMLGIIFLIVMLLTVFMLIGHYSLKLFKFKVKQ